ncbi:MAG: metal dependent phosphohydrolase [Firmicutes bacterium]|nr:metal dependent phosphohydrolase [Bacillota bacterium]
MRIEHGLAALILAGGYSSRAPGFKPLLPLGNSVVIENTINNFRRANIVDIIVVAGHRLDELLPILNRLPVRPVFNENYSEGMFSSVVAGVQSLWQDTEAFFLLPADMPLVRSHTIKLLGRAYKRTGADVIYPVFRGRRGHPPLITARLAPVISTWDGTEGLRQLLKKYESKAYEVEVSDEGVMLDVDTQADYREACERWNCRHFPSQSECEAIMVKLKVPESVVRHGKVVAEVACRLAARLNQAGLNMDAGLIASAGVLHDIAKGTPDHARNGARILCGMGYPRVAAIVAVHTDIVFEKGVLLNEASIVYLADKLVKNDRIVSVEERFQYALERASADDAARAAIGKRLSNGHSIINEVERRLGTDAVRNIAAESMIFRGAER